MGSSVNVDPEALRGFREDLAAYGECQAAAMADVTQEIERIKEQVQAHVDRCEAVHLASVRVELQCLRSCDADGYPLDCSRESAATAEAAADLARARAGLQSVQDAEARWAAAERAHAEALSAQLPRLQAGLDRRLQSLDQYSSWSLSILAGLDLARGARWPTGSAERPELRGSGKEARG